MSTLLTALPTLSDEYKQQQQQAVLDSDVLYQFELIKEPFTDYISNCLGVVLVSFLNWVGSLGGWMYVLLMIVLITPMGVYFYYASNPSIQQTVTLTEKGIIVSNLELVPDTCYAALRYSGYVGVAISVIAVIFVGPMAFVGAGAGLLMSFKMVGVVNRPRVQIRPFIKGVDYLEERGELRFKHGLTSYYLSVDIDPYQLSDEAHNEMRVFHEVVYHADSESQADFMKALNQIVNTRKIATCQPS